MCSGFRGALGLAGRCLARFTLDFGFGFGTRLFPLHEGAQEHQQLLTTHFPYLRGHATQHGAVVADDQHAAFVRLNRVFHRFNGFHVEMICWLVENEQVRRFEREQRERHACTFTARERANGTLHFVATETEAAEVPLDLTTFPKWSEIGDHVIDRARQRQMRKVLPIVCNGGRRTALDATRCRGMFFEQCADERRLA